MIAKKSRLFWIFAVFAGATIGALVSAIPFLGLPGLVMANYYFLIRGMDPVLKVSNTMYLVHIVAGNMLLWIVIFSFVVFKASLKRAKEEQRVS